MRGSHTQFLDILFKRTMHKKYTIEVPIYSSPLKHLIKLNRSKDINIIIYGGAPDSPLNGGRLNYSLDGLFIWNRIFFRLTRSQLRGATKKFYQILSKANENGIQFFLAFTNMFVSPDELNEENLRPVKWLVESYKKHGVKNGIIINNEILEGFIRKSYGDNLFYVSSCTKYVSPHKLLSPSETLKMYLKDSSEYDFVVLTPQDSRRENLIKDVVRQAKCGVIAICNSYCANRCNSYYHYEYTSKMNKKSINCIGNISTFLGAFNFTIKRALNCSAFLQPFRAGNIENIAEMQLNSGITNFKLGRGFGDKFLDHLVSLIEESEAHTDAAHG